MKFSFTTAAALTGSLLALSATSVSASDDINPWQHCGIGAAIFDSNTTAAALSNVIWDSGTTAVTSATMSPETCNSKEVEVAQFIDESYDQLALETAMGEGEYLNAALSLMNCRHSATQDNVVRQLRSDLSAASAVSSYTEQPYAAKAYDYYKSLNQATADCSAS
ncbi:hypothetical protein GCM10022228_03900 [Halomonas cibimaris]|uniref:DUF3015 domain-containing protein n=1 Tax=Halomonas cibimaris TaxID=657012 RepID=A0ABP7LBF3_9GAMM